MVTKTVTYKDYTGKERSEKLYFNLTEAELVDWQTENGGGLKDLIETMMSTQDIYKVLNLTKELVKRAYGTRISDDGSRFIKDAKESEYFVHSEAFSEMFMEFANEPNKLAEFIKAVIPKKLLDKVEEMEKTEKIEVGTIASVDSEA